MNPVSHMERVAPRPSVREKKQIVLFVDYQPEVLDSIRSVLAKEPYELLGTERPRQALQWVKEKGVSLIVSEQVMPEMFGTDLLEQVKASSPATRCAILTAYPEGAKLLRWLKLNPSCVMPKPWDEGILKRTVRTLLQPRRQGSGASD